ncbi:MPN/PAD-1 domain-containing protein [Tieghemostelium lacteum]|uniref:MPN/PAD-1 domain-containing protein n=1 Tax=Tieghemostelium lacteum TaxID=361077 RepID=A0A151ZFV9_TIELA|nr:MPN/PAD-1 domain-containing protein [Tieghemostelium lacteum]|eukprot:KYQ92853.1 MPN/PAD-1 domain-containing protein [Tieghemostelium lacteum]
MPVEQPLHLATSIQELVNEHAESIDIDKSFKIYHYLCTSNNLIKQASIYKTEGDIERAYIYLLRFCILAIEKLPNHPEYNDVKFAKSRDTLRKDAVSKLEELENLKKQLVERYRQLQSLKDQEQEKRNQQRLLEEQKREEKRIKEQNDKLQLQEQREHQELENELKKLNDQNDELESFNKRKSENEKKLRQNLFKKQAQLLREEAIQLLKQEALKDIPDTTSTTTVANDIVPILPTNVTSDTSDILDITDDNTQQLQSTSNVIEEQPQQQQQKDQEDNVDIILPDIPKSNPSLNLDSDELIKYLEESNKQKANSIESTNTKDFLVDPDFASPPKPAISTVNIPSTPVATTSLPIVQSPKSNVNIPITYGGYPTYDQLQQQQQINYNQPKWQPPPQQLQHQQITSPPYNFSNNGYYPQQNTPPQYAYQQQPQQIPLQYNNNNFKLPPQSQLPPQYPFSPNIPQLPTNHVNITPNIPQYQQPKLPLNPSQILQKHQHPSPNLLSTQQQPQGPKQSSYLSTIQQKPNTLNTTPINQTLVGSGVQSGSVPNPQQSQQQPQQKPKTNIDSPEASKKYSKLRKIIINGEILNEFMVMAQDNTRRSIETCGILSGSLSNDVFKVTTLIIPKQEGTSDTCNTVDEHEIFEYQLENDLLTLGWIHTHPTQDCFLSAVDVHTHCSYQYLLPEAVAIVMSPRANPNFGIFRLTDPPGIQTVQKCKLKSFHPHPPVNGIPIYTKSEHVDLLWGKNDSKVVDLRKKK